MKNNPGLTVIAIAIIFLSGAAGFACAEESDTKSATVEERLRIMGDREEIRDLIIAYGRDLDSHDLVAYSKLFARDGVWEGGVGSAQGPDGILKMLNDIFSRIPASEYRNSFHILSSMKIDITGPDSATAWTRWTYFVEGEDGKPKADRSGHYEDTLVREDGHWKFKYRNTISELPTAKSNPNDIWRKDYQKSEGGTGQQ